MDTKLAVAACPQPMAPLGFPKAPIHMGDLIAVL